MQTARLVMDHWPCIHCLVYVEQVLGVIAGAERSSSEESIHTRPAPALCLLLELSNDRRLVFVSPVTWFVCVKAGSKVREEQENLAVHNLDLDTRPSTHHRPKDLTGTEGNSQPP